MFWFLWGVDVVAALVALYFFFVGLGDGSVSAFNARIWILLLLGLATVVIGGPWLRGAGHPRLARALVTALGVPTLGVGLFFLVLLVTRPRFN
ncbi:MAG: osmoprotectant transporter permease [bacterium]